MASRRVAVSLIVASVALLGLSVTAGYGEIGSTVSADATLDDRMSAIADGSEAPGASLLSRNQYLDGCLNPSANVYFMLQPTETYQAFLARCGDVARSVAASAPILGKAWLASARMAADSGDLDRFRRDFATSFSTGANVAALASNRLALAIDHYGDLDQRGHAIFNADLATLIESRQGADVVAQYYVGHPDLQELITSIGEKGSTAAQQWLLTSIRSAANR